MQDAAALLPIVAIALLFWLLIVRPASRRQAKMRDLQNSLAVGSRVLLAAGLYGTVRSVADDRVEIEVAEGVVVTVAKGSVVQILDQEGLDEGGLGTATAGDLSDDSHDGVDLDKSGTSGSEQPEQPGTEGSK